MSDSFDAVIASHSGPMRVARLGKRPQLPSGRAGQRPALRPASPPRDLRRPERGIGVVPFSRKIGDTYTTVLNLRGLLEVRKDRLTATTYKMFGVLINQQERCLAALETKAGTTAQVAELRRIRSSLDEIFHAIEGLAAPTD